MRSVLLDLDGVLYVGDEGVLGASKVVDWLKNHSIPFLFLTNTTSRPRSQLVDKLAQFDIESTVDEFLTPPVAACHWLRQHSSGSIALFVPPATQEEFQEFSILEDDAVEGASAVVVGDLGMGWNFERLNRAFRLLMGQPKPVLIALGMTRFWNGPEGLRLDTGPYVMALQHASDADVVVTGKPAVAFYQAAINMLGTAPKETLMVGDDIRGDIEGAQKAGLKAALVRTGKFRSGDLDSEVKPDGLLNSIADLPIWWQNS